MDCLNPLWSDLVLIGVALAIFALTSGGWTVYLWRLRRRAWRYDLYNTSAKSEGT